MCHCRRKAALLKKVVFFIPIQPLFSQSFRCVVSPLITYFESVLITSGLKVGTLEAAWMTAATSPTWFDCSCTGTLRAVLYCLSWSSHIPLLHLALLFLLSKQAPSVNTVIVWSGRFMPGACCLLTSMGERFFGSVKMQKHSDRSVLQEISGSKSFFSGFSVVALFQLSCVDIGEIKPLHYSE